jgi:hypothetical protein
LLPDVSQILLSQLCFSSLLLYRFTCFLTGVILIEDNIIFINLLATITEDAGKFRPKLCLKQILLDSSLGVCYAGEYAMRRVLPGHSLWLTGWEGGGNEPQRLFVVAAPKSKALARARAELCGAIIFKCLLFKALWGKVVRNLLYNNAPPSPPYTFLYT